MSAAFPPPTPVRRSADAADGPAARAPGGQGYATDLDLALHLADAADAISTARFLAMDLRVDSKPDTTPVTDADLAVEAALREILERERAGDGILGEESGLTNPLADRQWIIDPIDGTKSFLRGVPVWATLIALEATTERGREVVVGVASAPALGRRWWASAGEGAYTSVSGHPALAGTRQLHVSGVSDLADASLSYSSWGGWRERRAGFESLVDAVWRTRAYGDFWSALLVAEGAVDIAAEPEVSVWDLAVLDVIVREAGGRFSGVDGTAGPRVGSALAPNGRLHEEVLRRLSP